MTPHVLSVVYRAIRKRHLAPHCAAVDLQLGEIRCRTRHVVVPPEQDEGGQRRPGENEDDAEHGQVVAQDEVLVAVPAHEQAQGHEQDGEAAEEADQGEGCR